MTFVLSYLQPRALDLATVESLEVSELTDDKARVADRTISVVSGGGLAIFIGHHYTLRIGCMTQWREYSHYYMLSMRSQSLECEDISAHAPGAHELWHSPYVGLIDKNARLAKSRLHQCLKR